MCIFLVMVQIEVLYGNGPKASGASICTSLIYIDLFEVVLILLAFALFVSPSFIASAV